MRFCDWLSSLGILEKDYLSMFPNANDSKLPIYLVNIGIVDRQSIHYANMVGWLESKHADNWCEIGSNSWASVLRIGFQDEAIAMEFKLTYGLMFFKVISNMSRPEMLPNV
jgi:hypothetical protein